MADTTLWYDAPANDWVEALPLGNAKVGAMVYAGVALDEIQLSESTFWAGSPHQNHQKGAAKYFPELKRLMMAGDVFAARDLIEKRFNTPIDGMPYQPIGSLMLRFAHQEDYSGYYRDLDLSQALASSHYQLGSGSVQKEYFASFSDKVMIIHLEAKGGQKLDFDAYYRGPATYSTDFNITNRTKTPQTDTIPVNHVQGLKPHPKDYPYYLNFDGDEMVMTSTSRDHEGIEGKVESCTITKIISDGQVRQDGVQLIVSGATEATIYVSIATNVENYHDLSGDEKAKARAFLDRALSVPYEEAKAKHIAYYKNQFDRVDLQLPNQDKSAMPTDQRLRAFQQSYDADLVSLLFQYGRYLLISSSQGQGQPATLQGIWVDTIYPEWDSKHTLNINQEMNYWLTNPTDLPESFMPMAKMYKELAETGAATAKDVYGADGWVVHHNTDLWRVTGMIDTAFHGSWPSGGLWLMSNIWEHYLFTGDKQYLVDVFPAMKGAADFFLSYAIEHPREGYLVTPMSNSPENAPKTQGGFSGVSLSMGPALDNQLAFDALSAVREASRILGGDPPYEAQLDAALSRLAPIKIGQYNQIQEWLDDVDLPNDTHRHMSHLYAFYPSNQISPFRTPELAAAAKQTLITKGDHATGWSIAWKISLWARALDGDHANLIIKNLVNYRAHDHAQGLAYPNLFFACPPFQMDASFGLTAGVSEMLLQSQDGAVHLLPALPKEWADGEVKGLLARGGFKVDIKWEHQAVTALCVSSRLGGQLRLRSYVPLQGDGLMPAQGVNANPFYQLKNIPQPLISDKIQPKIFVAPKVYEYDVQTVKGERYHFEAEVP